ncbi:MAG TPA: GGDEF domain-containing protein [Solirubrobacteraceae bacterium]|nr:GGDEF domain-containing protein [Solirubrobacteraceae bacterium]
MRVALLALLAAMLIRLLPGTDGFWLGLPAVLLAVEAGGSAAGATACGGAVLLAAVASAAAAGAALPPLWLILAAPGASGALLHRRLVHLRQERDAMEEAAHRDPLTGLANRRQLLMVARHELERHRRAGERLAVVMLDLDGFKRLNDRYGHAAGDRMLRDVGEGLQRALRAQDTVARLGGDEFCVIAPATIEARALAAKVSAAVEQASRGRAAVRASLGVAVYPEDGATIEQLLQAGDERLLTAKRRRQAGGQRRVAA